MKHLIKSIAVLCSTYLFGQIRKQCMKSFYANPMIGKVDVGDTNVVKQDENLNSI